MFGTPRSASRMEFQGGEFHWCLCVHRLTREHGRAYSASDDGALFSGCSSRGPPHLPQPGVLEKRGGQEGSMRSLQVANIGAKERQAQPVPSSMLLQLAIEPPGAKSPPEARITGSARTVPVTNYIESGTLCGRNALNCTPSLSNCRPGSRHRRPSLVGRHNAWKLYRASPRPLRLG
jgi:hypothetical protein